MTLTIELPDNLASQFAEQVTPKERNTFFAEAIADKLSLRQKEMEELDTRWLAALNAELDPEKEPERDAAECKAAIEASIAEAEAGGKSYTLEEMSAWIKAQSAARLAAKSA